MAIIYLNTEKLTDLDSTGEQMEEIKEKVTDLYNLKYYKKWIIEYAVKLGSTETSEDNAAEIAKRCFVEGYMQAASDLTDRYAEIIAQATIRR